MNTGKRRDRGGNTRPSIEDVAGNGLIHRRALLGRGIMLAGAMTAGAGASLTSAAAEPLKDDPWSLEMGAARRRRCRCRRGSRSTWCARSSNPKTRIPQLARPHAAPSAQRHDHAQRRCTSRSAIRPAGYRPRQAPARDPRPGEAAAGVHARSALALSDGDAHGVRRVRRQLRADVLQRAAAGDRAGAARPRFLLGMDRRAALDAAGRGRHRSEGEMADRRRRRLRSRSIAACRSRRPGRRDDRALPERRADRCPATAIRCACCCPATKAT